MNEEALGGTGTSTGSDYANQAQVGPSGLSRSIHSEFSHIDNQGENFVVLSERLKFLCEQVGGCSVEQVKAVARRIVYELLTMKR